MPGRRILTLATTLWAFAACGVADPGEAETEGPVRRTTPIDPMDMGDIDAVGLRLEDLVGTGDIEGVEDMWLRAEQLRGCRLGRTDPLPNAELEAFLAEKRAEFRERANETFSHAWSGALVFTHHDSAVPEIMSRRLRGAECPADAFGRVWVYVRRSDAPRLVEHRFNLERVGKEWRVFAYQGRRARCTHSNWADGPMCAHLGDSRAD